MSTGVGATSATLRKLRAVRDRVRKDYLVVRGTSPDNAERGRLWREFLDANDVYRQAKGQTQ